MGHALFFTLLLVFGYVNPASSSSLELIASDFRRLTRVTNAIYLQSVAINNTIRARDLLSELLDVPTDALNKSIDFDIRSARDEIQRLHDGHRKFVMDKNDMSRLYSPVRAAKNPFTRLQELHEAELSEIQFSTSVDLFKAARDIVVHPMFNNNCSKLNLTELKKFRELFSTDGKSFKLPEEVEIRRILDDFRNSTDLVIECIKSFGFIPSSLEENSELLIHNEKYQKVMDTVKFASEFVTIYNSSLVQPDKNLDIVLQLFANTSKIWSPSTPLAKLNETMSMFRRAVDTIWVHRHSPSAQKNSNLQGFNDAEDLLKVFEDLQSPWFKKEIAKGASTKNLENALRPYHKMVTEAVEVAKTWDTMYKNISTAQLTFIAVISKKMLKITEFQAQKSHYLNVLKSWKGRVQKQCMKGIQQNATNLMVFWQELYPIQQIVELTQGITNRATELQEHLEFISSLHNDRAYFYGSALEDVQDAIMARSDDPAFFAMKAVQIALDNAHRRQTETFHDSDFDFYASIDTLVDVLEDMDRLKEMSGSLTAQALTVEGSQVIEEMKLTEIEKCLEKEKFNTSAALYPMNVLTDLIRMTEKPMGKVIDDWLGHLDKVKKSLHKAETSIIEESQKKSSEADARLILSLNEAKTFSQQLGANTKVLEDLAKSRMSRRILLNLNGSGFPEEVGALADSSLGDWMHPKGKLKQILEDANRLEKLAKDFLNSSVLERTKVFEAASGIHGIEGSCINLRRLHGSIQATPIAHLDESQYYFGNLTELKLDLDFASHHAQLRASRTMVLSLQEYFDEIFGNNKSKTTAPVTVQNWLMILGFCVGVIFLIFIGALLAYGLTENGRTTYQNLYLFYFGKPAEFEKRWRYSLFMDQINSKNALLDAAREANYTNLLHVLKNGAYVDVYNKFGNTALHLATKLAHSDLVEVLIKYGADRSLLNASNRIPEQMIPANYQKMEKDKVEEYEKIMAIYKKCSRRKYRVAVPQKFPTTSFHIFYEDRTDNELTDKFMSKFNSICCDEATPTTTHFVVKTDGNGVWEVEKFELLTWIFNGIIIVKEQWMADCLVDEKLIAKDCNYLVERVKYRGQLYDAVLPWSEAIAKGKMPFLIGAYVAVVIAEYSNLALLSSLVDAQGGVMLACFPTKTHFNKNAHPYLHGHLGPLFLIHDGSMDLSVYKNDADKMYTLFTEEEFLIFMLKREITRDTRENPPEAMKEQR